jgi:TRAP-type C4-dicarboxylate transport system substrate-binding protein
MMWFSGFNPRTYKKELRQLVDGGFTMVDVLKKSGVRDAADGVNVGSDFYDALDDEVKDLIERAVERAQENGRKTVKARDV